MLIGATVWVSRGRLEPRDYDLKEYWTWKGPGQPPWFVRAMNRRRARGQDGDEAEQSKHAYNPGDAQTSANRSRQNSSTADRSSANVAMPLPTVASRLR
jgi:AGZA family xanthine/uracil permease-like MFS transporter